MAYFIRIFLFSGHIPCKFKVLVEIFIFIDYLIKIFQRSSCLNPKVHNLLKYINIRMLKNKQGTKSKVRIRQFLISINNLQYIFLSIWQGAIHGLLFFIYFVLSSYLLKFYYSLLTSSPVLKILDLFESMTSWIISMHIYYSQNMEIGNRRLICPKKIKHSLEIKKIEEKQADTVFTDLLNIKFLKYPFLYIY